MEQMYTDAIDYHIYALLLLVLTITLFYLYTQMHKEFLRYQRMIRTWMPIYIFALSATTFTGIVMMAAKQLSFSFSNSMMIIATLFLIALEVTRHKRLRQTTQAEDRAYTIFAKRIYAIELLITFATVYIAKMAHQ